MSQSNSVEEESKEDELMRTAIDSPKECSSPLPKSMLKKIADRSMRDIEQRSARKLNLDPRSVYLDGLKLPNNDEDISSSDD